MKCEKCGKEYWTRECLNCKENYTENDLQKMGISSNKKSLSEKEKLFKVIRYAIIFFIGIIIIGAIAEIYIINKVVDTAKPTIDNMNKMTNTMNKATEQMLRDMQKANENLRKNLGNR
ncbi:MAG: hypothetical protein PHX65_07505 [Sulfurimonas sp.]|nr:hypothetical protein [Sulfurimonas sp.]